MKKSIVYLLGAVLCCFLSAITDKPREALLAAVIVLITMAAAHALNKE